MGREGGIIKISWFVDVYDLAIEPSARLRVVSLTIVWVCVCFVCGKKFVANVHYCFVKVVAHTHSKCKYLLLFE